MKIKITFFVLLFALPFLGNAQSSSLGLSSSYMVGQYYKQYGLGLAFANQYSDYVSGRVTLQAVFSEGGFARRLVYGVRCPSNVVMTRENGYDKYPSILEMSYLVRFRPIKAKHKIRCVVGSGLVYRYTNLSNLFSSTAVDAKTTFTDIFLPKEVSSNVFALGLPINLGLELDLNKKISLAFEGEIRSFFLIDGKLNRNNAFMHSGANLNLMYHLFGKK